MSIIGIIANPASGKDVRRLVARASVFDNQEKQAIVRRVLEGIHACAPDAQIAYLNDAHGIVAGALRDVYGAEQPSAIEAVADTRFGNARDSTVAAAELAQLPAALVISLGGDGTNRAITLGWPDVPILPISTGTNNVFPVLIEATVAGAAAGLIAGGIVERDVATSQQKVVHVEIEGEAADLALIDAVFIDERFIGARALLDPEQLRLAVLTTADPAAVGMTSIGGLIEPTARDAEHGLLLEFGRGTRVKAPIAPGLYRQVEVSSSRRLPFATPVTIRGPGVLAFDGERERVLRSGQQATLQIRRDGPHLIDPGRALHLAAERGAFLSG